MRKEKFYQKGSLYCELLRLCGVWCKLESSFFIARRDFRTIKSHDSQTSVVYKIFRVLVRKADSWAYLHKI